MPTDWNYIAGIKEKVRDAVRQITALTENDRPNIVCLNEIFFAGAATVCQEELSGQFPYWVWAAVVDGDEQLLVAGVGAAVGFVVGGAPGAAVGAGIGAILDWLYTKTGGNSGVMIFSEHPLYEFEFDPDKHSNGPKLRHYPIKTNNHRFSVLMGDYSENTGPDSYARKGFLVVKIRGPWLSDKPIYIVATHLQAAYKDEEHCQDDYHYNDPGCEQHAAVRRSQIDEIVTTMRTQFGEEAWQRTIIAGDLNIRGEPDQRTFVLPANATSSNEQRLSEWGSIFDYEARKATEWDPTERSLVDCFDGWQHHTQLALHYSGLPHGVDPGFTNFNVLGTDEDSDATVHRAQRLDYIVYHRNLELVPHVMLNRFKAGANHRSLEAHFYLKTNWCQPSDADDVTQHAPVHNNPDHVWLVHDHEPYNRSPRYDWVLIPTATRRSSSTERTRRV